MPADRLTRGISVVMPVRNGGEYLDSAVNSILRQTYSDIELILIDDHSTDHAISRLDLSDGRIKVIKNTGQGIVSALNLGIKHARMPFIARMDADDIALPERLDRQLNYLADHPEVQICGSQVELFKESGRPGDGYRLYQDWINGLTCSESIARNIFIESPVPHPSAVMRKKLIDDLGGYRDTGCPEDYDLWLRAHLHGCRFGKPEGVLLYWRDHESRFSRNSQCYSKKAFFKIKAYHLTRLYRNRRFRIWGSGSTGGLLFDEIQSNTGNVADFIDVAPKRIGNFKRNRPVLDARRLVKNEDLVLVAVSARGARQKIRNYLDQSGFIEATDYICAA